MSEPLPQFEKLMKQHQGRLVRVVAALLRDPHAAREVCQQAFLKLWECMSAEAIPENPEAWLTRVAVNLGRNHLRGEARRLERERSYTDLQHADGAGSPSKDGGDPRVPALRQAIDKLPTQQRLVVTLMCQGTSLVQIAGCLGISPATARWHWQEARRSLRAMIPREGENEEISEKASRGPNETAIGGVLPSETGTP